MEIEDANPEEIKTIKEFVESEEFVRLYQIAVVGDYNFNGIIVRSLDQIKKGRSPISKLLVAINKKIEE